MSESVVLCEGYHDRAFWAGWLRSLRCTDLAQQSQSRSDARIRVGDPWDVPVTAGQYGYHSRSEKFIRLVPCGGDRRKILREATERLNEEHQRFREGAAQPRLMRLVLAIDSDLYADGGIGKTGFRHQDLLAWLKNLGFAYEEREPGVLVLFDGRTSLSLVRWEAGDAPRPGLPNQQTLERLVSAAVTAAYPQRAPAVQQWVDSRPDGPPPGPKEFAWSYMAGWYAEFGCQAFYEEVWRDERIAEELTARLTACGAWRVAEALAE